MIIILGILTLLSLLAVTFSAMMRTERSAAGNSSPHFAIKEERSAGQGPRAEEEPGEDWDVVARCDGRLALRAARPGANHRLADDERPQILADAWFYSDSANDLPLLHAVGHPVAVDPDERLQAEALRLGWQVRRLDRG